MGGPGDHRVGPRPLRTHDRPRRPLHLAGVDGPRAGAPVAEGVAGRVQRRPRRRARRLLRVPRRVVVDPHRARRRRRAACVPERVPPPRQRDLRGHGQGLAGASLPVPPVGVDHRRPPARSAVAARVRQARQRRVRVAARAGRHVGPARVREPRPRRDAARRVARGRARRPVVAVARRLPVQDPAHDARARELEGGRRGLLGDVPHPGNPPRDARSPRRHRRAAEAVVASRRVVPAVRGAVAAARPARRGGAAPVGVELLHALPG